MKRMNATMPRLGSCCNLVKYLLLFVCVFDRSRVIGFWLELQANNVVGFLTPQNTGRSRVIGFLATQTTIRSRAIGFTLHKVKRNELF
jgi:hypothetical protein